MANRLGGSFNELNASFGEFAVIEPHDQVLNQPSCCFFIKNIAFKRQVFGQEFIANQWQAVWRALLSEISIFVVGGVQ